MTTYIMLAKWTDTGAKQVKETAVIESDLAINKRRTDAQREIQIATQENEIQIASKSKQTSEAVAEAKGAEALAVSAGAADDQRIRPARLRYRDVVRRIRACRHAGRRRAPCGGEAPPAR